MLLKKNDKIKTIQDIYKFSFKDLLDILEIPFEKDIEKIKNLKEIANRDMEKLFSELEQAIDLLTKFKHSAKQLESSSGLIQSSEELIFSLFDERDIPKKSVLNHFARKASGQLERLEQLSAAYKAANKNNAILVEQPDIKAILADYNILQKIKKI